jgi:hypothetical protein
MSGIPYDSAHKITGGLSPIERQKLEVMDAIAKKKGVIPPQRKGQTVSVFDPDLGRYVTQETSSGPLLRLKGFDYERYYSEYFFNNK